MKTKTLITTLIIISILVSCAPVATETQTSTAIITAVHTTPTDTPAPIPTATPQSLPSETPTPVPSPVLISYTLWVDGGDELVNCVSGSNQPVFILYSDGELIIFRNNQYWHSILSQDEIDSLITQVSETGLVQTTEPENESLVTFRVLTFKGRTFSPPGVSYETSPFKKTVDILSQYDPEDLESYVPPKLTLWIYRIARIAPFEEYLPTPIPTTKDWSGEPKPLVEYGDGYHSISGDAIPKIMAQFDGFPDYQIFSEGKLLYITAICSDIPFQY